MAGLASGSWNKHCAFLSGLAAPAVGTEKANERTTSSWPKAWNGTDQRVGRGFRTRAHLQPWAQGDVTCSLFRDNGFTKQPRRVWYVRSCISLRVLGCRYVLLCPLCSDFLGLCWDVQCLPLLFPTLFSEHYLTNPEAHCFSFRLATQRSLEPVYLCSPTRGLKAHTGELGIWTQAFLLSQQELPLTKLSPAQPLFLAHYDCVFG